MSGNVIQLQGVKEETLEPATCPQCGGNNWQVYIPTEDEDATCVCSICGTELAPLLEFEEGDE